MRTLIATYEEEVLPRAVAEAVHAAGIDSNATLILVRGNDDEVLAYTGLTQTTDDFDPARSLHTIEDEELLLLLAEEQGAEAGEDILETVRDGHPVAIVYAERYQVAAVVAALKSFPTTDFADLDLTYRAYRHPAPQPNDPPASPLTSDFYAIDELDDREHTYDRGMSFDTRHSLFYPHYNQVYSKKGWPFSRVEGAYLFGRRYHTPDSRHIPWAQVAPKLRQAWENEEAAVVPWDDVEDAIRFGWETGGVLDVNPGHDQTD